MADNFFIDLIWKIENFTCCTNENNFSSIQSEDFTFPTRDQNSWNLILFPRRYGFAYGSSSFSCVAQIILFRKYFVQPVKDSNEDKDSDKSKDTPLKYMFCIWKNSTKWKLICEKSVLFEIGQDMEKIGFIWHDMLDSNIEDFLPGNVLTVRFKIWSEDIKFTRSTQINLRTCIPVEKSMFNWIIDGFSKLMIQDGSSSDVKIAKVSLITVTLSFLTICGEKGLKIVLTSDTNPKSFTFKCNVRIHGNGQSFVLSTDEIDSLPLSKFYKPLIPFKSIVEESAAYLVEDTLSLDVELYVISQNLENYVEHVYIDSSDEPSLWNRKIKDIDQVTKQKIDQEQDENLEDDSLKSDILLMYENKTMADYFINVESEMIPVHSNILFARSKIFYEKIKTHKANHQENILNIVDLDVDTVKNMLSYIYTDDIGEQDVDSAIKLYSAGNEYEIAGLKKKSAEFLIKNLTISNVCKILVLADQHSDENMKSKIVRFIAKNEKSLISSGCLKDFLKLDAKLAVSVFDEVRNEIVNCKK